MGARPATRRGEIAQLLRLREHRQHQLVGALRQHCLDLRRRVIVQRIDADHQWRIAAAPA